MNKKIKIFHFVLLLASFSLVFNACKEKDDDNPDIPGAVPTITLSSAEVSAYPGGNVTTSLSIDAPEGLKKVVIYKDGTALDEEQYNFEKTASYNFNYSLEMNLSAGTVINFAFEAIDSLDRKSEQRVFAVTVTEIPEKEVIQVTSDISSNTTWTADKIWRINDIVRVPDGITLTIEPGTVIFGASDSQGMLVIQRGGKIIAQGTPSLPIIFTSDKAPGQRAAGDWSGIVICGKAQNNQGNNISLEALTGENYGGTVNNDNSGILKYVRIEFAGKLVLNENNKEINSLTLASVGSGTVIENVQCSYGLDDSFELFGGTVNLKKIISYRTKDDDFDCDFGHSGFIQFAFALRDPNIADQFYSNGIEVDNDGAGTSLLPLTKTVFSNVTVIGGKYTADNQVNPNLQYAAQFRRNSMPSFYNSFLTGFPNGLLIDDTRPGASQHALNEELQARNVILAGVENWGNNGYGGNPNNSNGPLRQAGTPAQGFEVNTWFNTSSYNNSKLTKWQDAGIDESLYTSLTPKVTPNNGSMLLTAARWNNTPNASSFFEQVPFAGAFGSDDWTSGWVNWDPQNAVYK